MSAIDFSSVRTSRLPRQCGLLYRPSSHSFAGGRTLDISARVFLERAKVETDKPMHGTLAALSLYVCRMRRSTIAGLLTLIVMACGLTRRSEIIAIVQSEPATSES